MSDCPSNVDGRRTSERQKVNKAPQHQQESASSSSNCVPTIANSKRNKNVSLSTHENDVDQDARKPKSIRKQAKKSPNELSKFYCNGCNTHFPEFTSNKLFVRNHHLQIKGACLASCYICPLASCKSAHYNFKGFMGHIASCPNGRKIYNMG